MRPDHIPENDIERLMQNAFSNAEEQPPASVWDNIEQRHKSFLRRRQVRTVAILAAIVLATAAAIVLLTQPAYNDITMAQQPATPVDSTVLLPATTIPATTTPLEQPHNTIVISTDHDTKKLTATANTSATSEVVTTTSPLATTVSEPPMQTVTPISNHPDEELSPTDLAPAGTDTASSPSPRHAIHTRPMEPKWLIPNVITPNGDGINDCFAILGLEDYAPVQVVIYTAHSRRIFISDDYRNDFCGEGMPAGNYFYVITIKEGPSAGFVRRGTLVVKDR